MPSATAGRVLQMLPRAHFWNASTSDTLELSSEGRLRYARLPKREGDGVDTASPLPRTASVRGEALQRSGPPAARSLILTAAGLAALASVLIVHAGAHPAALGDPALTRLLRAMALIKASMAAAVIAAMVWRLGAPASPAALLGYAAAAAAMASGPVLIWGMTNLVSGTLLLHGGLISGLLLLWRDPATSERLKVLIAKRRLARR